MKKEVIYCDICREEIKEDLYPIVVKCKNVNIGRLNDICFNCGNKIAMLILSLQPPYTHTSIDSTEKTIVGEKGAELISELNKVEPEHISPNTLDPKEHGGWVKYLTNCPFKNHEVSVTCQYFCESLGCHKCKEQYKSKSL